MAVIHLASVLQIVVVICALTGTATVAQQDTDGDGLLDLLDVPGFDPRLGDGDFRWSGIEDLDGASLLTKATELLLSSNRIASLESGDFEGLTNLQSLILELNQISNIEVGSFSDLSNLRGLNLDENLLSSIDAQLFSGLTNLQNLGLWRNRISSLEVGDFSGLPNLMSLDLSVNRISSIEAGTFGDLPNLQSLELNTNKISSIEAGTFDDLPSLQELQLSRNTIASLERGAFNNLPRLRRLSLYRNRITSVEAGAFADLPNLETLQLNQNAITSLEAGVFENLSQLQWLALSLNPIINIEAGAFAGLTNLYFLDLGQLQVTHLNFAGADFDSLSTQRCEAIALKRGLCGSWNRVSKITLDDANLSSGLFSTILGVSSTRQLKEASLVGLSFVDSNPEDMSLLLSPTNLSDLTIDTNLYSLYQDEFDTFAAQSGKTLTIVDPDCNGDGVLNILDANCTPGRRIKYFLEDYGTVPGDANGVGGVEFADFLILQGNFGQSPAVYTDGDFDVDGKVAFTDFLILSANYGQGEDFTSRAVAVPEPSSLALVLLGILSLCRTRRNRTVQGMSAGSSPLTPCSPVGAQHAWNM